MLGETYSRREILAASERVIAGCALIPFNICIPNSIKCVMQRTLSLHYLIARQTHMFYYNKGADDTRHFICVWEMREDDARAPRWWASAGAREMRILKRQLPHLTTLSSPRLCRCSSIISIEINIFKEANNLTLDTLWCSGLGFIFGACHN